MLGLLRLPGRPLLLLRAGRRRHRRHPAGQRVARRDGPRLGDVRGLDQDPDRRGRHRAGLRLRQVLGRRAAPHAVAAARAVHDDPAVARHRVVGRPAGPRRHGRRPVGRARHGRGREPLAHRRREERLGGAQGRFLGRGAAGAPDVRRPAAQARLRPGDRRCRGDRAGRRRPGPRGLRPAGVAHRPVDVRRRDDDVARPDRLRVGPPLRRGARPRRCRHRRGRAPRRSGGPTRSRSGRATSSSRRRTSTGR